MTAAHKNLFTTSVILLGMMPAKAFPAAERFSPDLDVSVARVQESNIVLDESDLIVATGDAAYNTEMIVGFDSFPSTNLSFSARYTWNETRYDDLDEFNLRTQLLHGSAGYTFGKFTIGVDAFGADAGLGKEDYLNIKQLGPRFGFGLAKKLYLQGSLTHAQRSFAQGPERNTAGPQANLRLYYLLAGTNHYFLCNYKVREEHADLDGYDSSINVFGFSWVKKSEFYGKAIDASIRISHQSQHYSHQQPPRDDQLRDLQAGLQVHLSDRVYITVSYQHLSSTSTAENLDYRQHRTEVRLGVHL